MADTSSEPRIWDEFLTERDKQVFAASGYGARGGFGERPALLIIDVNYGFVGDKPEPILESVKRWMNSCGDEGWEAVAAIKTLLTAARAKGVPVIYTSGVRRSDAWDQGAWAYKNSRVNKDYLGLAPATLRSNIIVPDIAPGPQDLVIGKQKPSAFHGTPLMDYLVHLKCDSVLVTGTTTSGCVRATVVDAFSSNYRVTVVEDGCADRSQASHAVNLCDMNAKYADVVASPEVIAYINGLPNGLFDLPKGDASAGRVFAPDQPASKIAAE
ncbi:isochorismatase family protein [Lichenifustis flavocetrariae]|uniref:Isochorismatase family protein n=1 Tax=Lichenifustis flavocetrariae TaxID=2949735 RepID=A0AA41YTF7_9HYPH|nr:isochorismatase family protein [Lichenifustis flavocetrariae]MCW6507839.1 isochorismatase family protein [Lichenifustis flavocetrariae]